MFATNTQRLMICFCSERNDFIISSRAKRARSLLTARGLSHLQSSMPHKYFYICLVSANDVMEHFAFPGNIDFQFAQATHPKPVLIRFVQKVLGVLLHIEKSH